jgi:translocation and assembly module TamB
VPELPQDEVLSRLLFNKGTGALTAVEAVQLASSAAELTGMGAPGGGLLDSIRQQIGLDWLKFAATGDGNGGSAVEAGQYVADGVYVGVQQGLGEGSSRVKVEVEVTPNVSVETDVGADSEGRVGVSFGWDY